MRRAIPTVLAAAVTLTGAAAFFGNRWWMLDLAANFRVQLAVLSFLVLLVAGIAQSLPAAAIAAIGLTLNVAVIIPLYTGAVPSARTNLTIASFNLLSSNEEYTAVVEWILDTEADVVFLHEGTETWETALREANLPYDIVTTREPHFAFGTIALVPPGSDVVNHGFARTDHRAVEVVINRVTVIGIHPLAPVNEVDATLRNDQLAWAADRARSRSGEAIIIGDFNATPWSHIFRTAFIDAGLFNALTGSGPEATWRAGSVWQLPIDNAVHTDRLGVVSREVGPDLGSDHRPIIIEIGPRDYSG